MNFQSATRHDTESGDARPFLEGIDLFPWCEIKSDNVNWESMRMLFVCVDTSSLKSSVLRFDVCGDVDLVRRKTQSSCVWWQSDDDVQKRTVLYYIQQYQCFRTDSRANNMYVIIYPRLQRPSSHFNFALVKWLITGNSAFFTVLTKGSFWSWGSCGQCP